jgi:hypothetical protein
MMEKRLTAAELKSQQEAREKASHEAQEAAREEAARKDRDAERAALLAKVEILKASWYEWVEAASKRDGVRFVVIAQVISDASRLPELQEVMQSIQLQEYQCAITALHARGRPGIGEVSPDAGEAEVETGNLKGWRPAKIPRFGGNGTSQYLIVKWA